MNFDISYYYLIIYTYYYNSHSIPLTNKISTTTTPQVALVIHPTTILVALISSHTLPGFPSSSMELPTMLLVLIILVEVLLATMASAINSAAISQVKWSQIRNMFLDVPVCSVDRVGMHENMHVFLFVLKCLTMNYQLLASFIPYCANYT